jgi:hypothetical protein
MLGRGRRRIANAGMIYIHSARITHEEIIKQRIARDGEGKSGGFRTLILLKIGNRAFFVYGFAKNEKDNIEADDLIALKKLAAIILNYTDDQLKDSLNKNILIEVQCHE